MATHKATGAIIEGIAVRRRKEESSRAHVTFSFPVKGNEALYMAATLNQGNAVDLLLQILQGDMFSAAAGGEDEDEDEEQEDTEALEQIFAHDVDGADVVDHDDGSVGPGPEYGSLGSGEPGTDPLIDKLLEGAQDEPASTSGVMRPPTDEERAQAIENLRSESSVPADSEPPLPLRSRRR